MTFGRRGGVSTAVAFGINSALAFAAAELITVALHEAGHALAANALGFAPRIYPFSESNPQGTVAQSLIIDSAGPLLSLAIGVSLYAVYRSGTARYRFGRLLMFWMAWVGMMLFVNYLIITPLLTSGDTAHVADLLGLPIWSRYLIAIAGVVALVLLARPMVMSMMALAPGLALDSPRSRRHVILTGFLIPLLAGAMLCAIAGIGGNTLNVVVGLMGTFASVDIVIAALCYASSTNVPRSFGEVGARDATVVTVEPMAIALYLALVVLYVLVLRVGLPL